ncbi:hypothetical protein ACFQ4L_03295 [Lapidilactobacillus mulanensis]|uniref:Coil containing protein n=1 Tax=Lapidilactobacillus mulanensis TaxID=2485999 RepID=A0ABW4DPV3_9LACO|nr:hypothetical protein [Lapidilactobacillus mulanensis]
MNEREYEQVIAKLGSLREHLRRLEEDDYATAMYKGYSSDGLTLTEIMAEITTVSESVELLEERLASDPEQYL